MLCCHRDDEAVNQALAAYAINCELARSKEDVGLKTDFVVTIVALATNVCMYCMYYVYIVYVYCILNIILFVHNKCILHHASKLCDCAVRKSYLLMMQWSNGCMV